MRFAVEAWAPEYGAPSGENVLEPAETKADASVELDPAAWRPLDPPASATDITNMLVVDGVQRVEALVWITDPPDAVRAGVCGSVAAGAVRCTPDRAVLEDTVVERALCSSAAVGADIATSCGPFRFHPTSSEDLTDLRLALHRRMIHLEARLAADLPPAELVLVDGPLRQGHTHTTMVGFVKTHSRSYGPEVVRDTIAGLRPGQRTPLLCIGDHPRYTWYLRLPGVVAHPWSGVVRLEASGSLAIDHVRSLADRLARTLPRYASSPHKDRRAPQNLIPIGGLERDLRHRLGDPRLVQRALQKAATATPSAGHAGGGSGPT